MSIYLSAAVQVSLRPGDTSWADFLAAAPAHAPFQAHVADAYDVTNILFSSGTTGGAGLAPAEHSSGTSLCLSSCTCCP